jgi:hypothetical protein
MRFIIEQLRIKLPPINPSSSKLPFKKNTNNGVTFEYKYSLLDKKVCKKEYKRNLKLIAIKITNTEDLVFRRDLVLTYDDNMYALCNGKETV